MFLHRRENGYWYLWYQDTNGRKRKVSTKRRYKGEALQFAKEFVATSTKRQSITIGDYISEYLNYSSAVHTSETKKVFNTCLTQLKIFVGDVKLTSVGPSLVERFLADKIRHSSLINAKKYYQHLRSAFETAVKWGYCKENPFAKVTKPKAPQVRAPFFTPDDFRIFLQKISDQDFKELCITGFLTGLRLNELLHLEWKEIDIGRRIVELQNKVGFTTKNKLSRNIPICDELFSILCSRKLKVENKSPLVFTTNGIAYNAKWVSKTFKRFVRMTSLNQDLHFHSLRHSFCSNLVSAGVSLYTVQRLAGHSNPSVTQAYSHLQPEMMHDVVNSVKVGLN